MLRKRSRHYRKGSDKVRVARGELIGVHVLPGTDLGGGGGGGLMEGMYLTTIE